MNKTKEFSQFVVQIVIFLIIFWVGSRVINHLVYNQYTKLKLSRRFLLHPFLSLKYKGGYSDYV